MKVMRVNKQRAKGSFFPQESGNSEPVLCMEHMRCLGLPSALLPSRWSLLFFQESQLSLGEELTSLS